MLYSIIIAFYCRMDDKYFIQNKAIGEFRKFSFLKNVHVSIVMHPRKVGCILYNLIANKFL